MAFWQRKDKDKREKVLREKEPVAFKYFEEGKNPAFVAADLRLTSDEASTFYEKWKTLSRPNDEDLQARAFQFFEESKSVVFVSTTLKMPISRIQELYAKYCEVVNEAKKTQDRFNVEQAQVKAQTFTPPFRIRKTVRNMMTGLKNKLEYYPQTFDHSPEDMEWLEFSQEMGDGTYYVLDSRNKVVKSVPMNGMGFEDPSEKDPDSYMRMQQAQQARMMRSAMTPTPSPGPRSAPPQMDDEETEEQVEMEAQTMAAKEDRERAIMVRLMEIHVARGNTAAAERIWKYVHKDEVVEDGPTAALAGPVAAPVLVPGVPGAQPSGSFKEWLRDYLDTKDMLEKASPGGGESSPLGKQEKLLVAGKELVQSIAENIAQPLISAYVDGKGSPAASAELDQEVRKSLQRGTWRRVRRVVPATRPIEPQPPADLRMPPPTEPPTSPPPTPTPELPPKTSSALLVPPTPITPPSVPTEPPAEIETYIEGLNPVEDSDVPLTGDDLDVEVTAAAPAEVGPDEKWMLEKGLPRFIGIIVNYAKTMEAGDLNRAKDLTPEAVARTDFGIATKSPFSVFFGKKRLLKAYKVARDGFDALLKSVEPEVQKQTSTYEKTAKLLQEMGDVAFLKAWNPPPGIPKERGLVILKEYVRLRSSWDFLQTERARAWLTAYLSTFAGLVEHDVTSRNPGIKEEITA